jgi:hypothetical protein
VRCHEREMWRSGRGAPGAACLSTRDSTENENATRVRQRPRRWFCQFEAEIQRPGGLAPPAPGPAGSEGLPDPLGAGFLGAALAPFFVVVAWPVVSICCVPPPPWVALGAPPPPAIGPDGALGLPPDCWAFATMTPPTSAAAASRLASIFIETSRDVPRLRLPSRKATLSRNLALSRAGTSPSISAARLPRSFRLSRDDRMRF